MTKAFRHTCIPAYWLELVLKEKSFRDAQVLIILKAKFGASRHSKDIDWQDVAKTINISVQTAKRAIKRLLNRNWIGYNESNHVYYFRGWDGIMLMEKIHSRRGCWFDVTQIKRFKSFVIAACITNLIISQKKKPIFSERQKSGRQFQSGKMAFPVAINSLSKIYNLKHATSQRYINLAVNERWLSRKKKFQKLDEHVSNLGIIQESYIGVGKIAFDKKYNCLVINYPSEYKSSLVIKKRRLSKMILSYSGIHKGKQN